MVGLSTAASPIQPPSVLCTGSNDSFINVETLSPVSVTQQSPKGVNMGALSPRTPQISPKLVQLSSPKTVAAQLQSQLQGASPRLPTSVVQLQSMHQKGVAASGLRLQIGSTTSGKPLISQIVHSPQVKQVAAALVQGSGTPTTPTQPQIIGPGGKPVAFSLIHSQGGTKIVESVSQGQAGHPQITGTRTVVLSTRDEGAGQQLQRVTVTHNKPQSIPATAPMLSQAQPQMVTVTHSSTPSTVRAQLLSSLGGAAKPMVTRIVQQGSLAQSQQLGGLVLGSTAGAPTSIKIQSKVNTKCDGAGNRMYHFNDESKGYLGSYS